MGNAAFENVCNGLLERLNAGKSIEEEHVSVFMNSIAGLQKEEAASSPAYKKLYDALQKMWHYKDLKVSYEENFLLGGIWGVLKLIHEEIEKKQRRETLDLLVAKYKDQYWFLEEIDRNPGIKHKDLAKKGGKSTSQLSQFFKAISAENLVGYNRAGREKYYYLQQTGRLVYDEIKKYREKKRSLSTYAEPFKRISIDNEKREIASLIPVNLYQQGFSAYIINEEIVQPKEKVRKYINHMDNLELHQSFGIAEWAYGNIKGDKELISGNEVKHVYAE